MRFQRNSLPSWRPPPSSLRLPLRLWSSNLISSVDHTQRSSTCGHWTAHTTDYGLLYTLRHQDGKCPTRSFQVPLACIACFSSNDFHNVSFGRIFQADEALFCPNCGNTTALGQTFSSKKPTAPTVVSKPQSTNCFQVQLPYNATPGQTLQVAVPQGYAQAGQIASVCQMFSISLMS
jgi:hypothetical protein